MKYRACRISRPPVLSLLISVQTMRIGPSILMMRTLSLTWGSPVRAEPRPLRRGVIRPLAAPGGVRDTVNPLIAHRFYDEWVPKKGRTFADILEPQILEFTAAPAPPITDPKTRTKLDGAPDGDRNSPN